MNVSNPSRIDAAEYRYFRITDDFSEVSVNNSTFRNGSIRDIDGYHGEYRNSTFERVEIRNVDWTNAFFYRCTFIQCHFVNVDTRRANFVECRFVECAFENVPFRRTRFSIGNIFDRCEVTDPRRYRAYMVAFGTEFIDETATGVETVVITGERENFSLTAAEIDARQRAMGW